MKEKTDNCQSVIWTWTQAIYATHTNGILNELRYIRYIRYSIWCWRECWANCSKLLHQKCKAEEMKKSEGRVDRSASQWNYLELTIVVGCLGLLFLVFQILQGFFPSRFAFKFVILNFFFWKTEFFSESNFWDRFLFYRLDNFNCITSKCYLAQDRLDFANQMSVLNVLHRMLCYRIIIRLYIA